MIVNEGIGDTMTMKERKSSFTEMTTMIKGHRPYPKLSVIEKKSLSEEMIVNEGVGDTMTMKVRNPLFAEMTTMIEDHLLREALSAKKSSFAEMTTMTKGHRPHPKLSVIEKKS